MKKKDRERVLESAEKRCEKKHPAYAMSLISVGGVSSGPPCSECEEEEWRKFRKKERKQNGLTKA